MALRGISDGDMDECGWMDGRSSDARLKQTSVAGKVRWWMATGYLVMDVSWHGAQGAGAGSLRWPAALPLLAIPRLTLPES